MPPRLRKVALGEGEKKKKKKKQGVLVRSDDPFDDGVSDLVVDRLVVGAADEELILGVKTQKLTERNGLQGELTQAPPLSIPRPVLFRYLDVDVVFALGDDLDVGVVDGLLVVLDARRPVGRRPQHLVHTDGRVD